MLDNSEDIVRRRIEETQQQLANPELTRRLAPQMAERLMYLSGQLYAPSIDNGILELTQDGIPVVVPEANTTLIMHGDSSGFTSAQFESMERQNLPITTQYEMATQLNKTAIIRLSGQVGARAFYRIGTYTSESGDSFALRGAPAIALGSSLSGPGEDTVLLHELVHAEQVLQEPFIPRGKYHLVRSEVEAYRVQAAFDTGLHPHATPTRAQIVAELYGKWRLVGRTLDTAEDRAAFEQHLQSQEQGIFAPAKDL